MGGFRKLQADETHFGESENRREEEAPEPTRLVKAVLTHPISISAGHVFGRIDAYKLKRSDLFKSKKILDSMYEGRSGGNRTKAVSLLKIAVNGLFKRLK